MILLTKNSRKCQLLLSLQKGQWLPGDIGGWGGGGRYEGGNIQGQKETSEGDRLAH